MILARIVHERARWFDLGPHKGYTIGVLMIYYIKVQYLLYAV